MRCKHLRPAVLLLITCAYFSTASSAEAQTAIDVTIKNHRFTPSEIHVPAGKPAVLNIKNEVRRRRNSIPPRSRSKRSLVGAAKAL